MGDLLQPWPMPGNEAEEARAMLQEWFDWWERDDTVRGKLPKALHIRTAVWLSVVKERESQ